MNGECLSENVTIFWGDSAKILQELPENSVDMMVTSPPYPGVDSMWGELFHPDNFEKAHEFLNIIWDGCLRALKPGGKMAINIANTKRRPYLPNVAKIYEWASKKIEPLGEIIWDKGYSQNGTAWGSYLSPADPALADQHEYILIFRKYGDREKPEIYNKIDGKSFRTWRNSMWRIAPAKASSIGHIAPFPPQIPIRLITLYSFENETILDPFMGSGTTGLACLDLNRKFIGMELREDYYLLSKKLLNDSISQLRLF